MNMHLGFVMPSNLKEVGSPGHQGKAAEDDDWETRFVSRQVGNVGSQHRTDSGLEVQGKISTATLLFT